MMTKVNEEFVFYFRNFQLTEDGQVGVDGRRVVNLVELVPNNALEAVQSLLRIMAGNIAQEQHGKHKSAIRNLALVRNKTQTYCKVKIRIYEIHIFELRNEEINVKKILAVVNATYAVAKRKPEKIRLAGIRTLTSAILVQRSNQLS